MELKIQNVSNQYKGAPIALDHLFLTFKPGLLGHLVPKGQI